MGISGFPPFVQKTPGAPGLDFETWESTKAKSGCFVSGHDFSRAEELQNQGGLY
jgi:hypothetical protein